MMGKMRSLAPWFILTVGGLFVLFMVISDSNVARYFGQQRNNVGSINGTDITYQEFSRALENARSYQQQQGQDIEESQMPIFRDQVWNAIVMQYLLAEKMNEFDITVTDDEIKDVLLGPNPPADLRQNFIDSTGNFNREMYETALFDPQNKNILIQLEDRVRQQKMQEKLQSLLFASITVTEAEVRRSYMEQNTSISAQYAFINNANIPDSTVKLSDEDLLDYYNEHKDDYKVEEQRKVKYVLFKKEPSSVDSSGILTDLTAILSDLRSDTSSFKTYADIYSEVPYKMDTLNLQTVPEAAKDLLVNAKNGDILGPVLANGSYIVYRLVNKTNAGKSLVRASHILIKGDNAESKAKADELYKQLTNGADFAKLAKENSEDPGSAARGGDLGWFGEGQMVPEFNDACFNGRIGVVQKPIKTTYGYHIIKVTNKNSQNFVVESIVKKIVTSPTTLDKLYNAANDFAYVADKDGFENEAKLMNYEIKESYAFGEKSKSIAGLGQNEALVKFAFENSIGDVSDAFNMPVGYIVAAVSEIEPAGYKPFEDVKNNVKNALMREKKNEISRNEALKIIEKVAPTKDLNLAKEVDPKVAVDEANNFKVVGRVPGVGNEFGFMEYALDGKLNEISEPIKGSRGYYVIKITDRTPFDSTSYSVQKFAIRDNILRQKKQNIYSQWITKVQDEADIIDNRYMFWR